MYTSVKTGKKRRHVGPTCFKIPGENTATPWVHNTCTTDTPHGGHSQLDYWLSTLWVQNTCTQTHRMEDTASSTTGSQHHGFTAHALQTHCMEDTASLTTGSQHHGFTTHALQTHRMEDTASSTTGSQHHGFTTHTL